MLQESTIYADEFPVGLTGGVAVGVGKKQRKDTFMMLKDKTVILGVTGGIAAYKSAALASMLVHEGADVRVIMTEHAQNFIHPLTFETLTGHKCICNTFDRSFEYNVAHVELAKRADVVMVAPATANVIAKLAHGIADDMLTTTFLASSAPKMIVPAMNTGMYENPIVQENLSLLQKFGMEVVPPTSGRLACGDVGVGKMPEPEVLREHLLRCVAYKKDLAGQRILITAGPTQEKIDPIRYITNHSSGKMGYSIARICMLRGANVTLVTGKTCLTPPMFVDVVEVVTAKEMFDAVTSVHENMDVIIKTAAVADYRPTNAADEKIKKSKQSLLIALERTEDILQYLGNHKKPGQFLCGFCMETQDLLGYAQEKFEKKHLDMIVANHLKEAGAGFGTDTNRVALLTKDGVEQLPLMHKQDVAMTLMDRIVSLQERVC